jgi:hypothetical protein
MSVDEPGDDRLPDEADDLRSARHGDLVHAGHGFDVPVPDQDHGVLHGCAARAVDQRRPFEGDQAVASRLAGGEEQGAREQGVAHRLAGHGLVIVDDLPAVSPRHEHQRERPTGRDRVVAQQLEAGGADGDPRREGAHADLLERE